MVAQVVEHRHRDPMDSMTRGSNPVRRTRTICESFSDSKCCADSSVCPTPVCIRTHKNGVTDVLVDSTDFHDDDDDDICIYIYIYIYIHTHNYIYVNTHTHMHRQRRAHRSSVCTEHSDILLHVLSNTTLLILFITKRKHRLNPRCTSPFATLINRTSWRWSRPIQRNEHESVLIPISRLLPP